MDADEIAEAKAKGAEEQAERAKELKQRLNDLWKDNTDTADENIIFELTDSEAENLIVQLSAAHSRWKETAKKNRNEVQDRDE